jgi:hypothetical protein
MAKPSWTRIKSSLKHLDQAALIEVIKLLYDKGDDNKMVLARYFDPNILTVNPPMICLLPKPNALSSKPFT